LGVYLNPDDAAPDTSLPGETYGLSLHTIGGHWINVMSRKLLTRTLCIFGLFAMVETFLAMNRESQNCLAASGAQWTKYADVPSPR
jgi:hypothetical protein